MGFGFNKTKSDFEYTIVNKGMKKHLDPAATVFREYLQNYELAAYYGQILGYAPLSMPILHLPVGRSSGGFGSSVALSSFAEHELKKNVDLASSKQAPSLISLAVGRIAAKYRMFQENSNTNVNEAFSKALDGCGLRLCPRH
jgi:hypothetical protein